MPENSVRNRLYCKYLQPAVRFGLEIISIAWMFTGGKNLAGSGIKVAHSAQLQIDPLEIKKILIIKLDHIGDFLLGLPSFQHLKASFPKAEVTLMCGGWNKALAEGTGLFDRIVCMNVFHEASGLCKGGIAFDQTLFDSFQLNSFDIAIDFRDNGETRFLLDLVGARFRVGFAANGEEAHMDLAFPSASFQLQPGSPTHHQMLQSLLASAVIAAITDAKCMSHLLSKVSIPASDETIRAKGRGPLIGINIGSGDAAKNWPLHRYLALCNQMIADLDATLVFIGSKFQEKDSLSLVQALPSERVINSVGTVTIPECMGLMQKLDLYIGNDTGTTHIAAGLNVPTICLFSGLTTYESHGAIGTRCCSLLADRKYGIHSIQIHHVLNAIDQLLGLKKNKQPKQKSWVNFVVVDSKPYKDDFRKYLLRSATRDGAKSVHIECVGPDVTITVDDAKYAAYDHHEKSEVIAADLRDILPSTKTIIFVGLGLSAYRLQLISELKRALKDSIVFYDVFDFFRYDAKGYRLAIQAALDFATRMVSDRCLLLDKGLSWLYPRSLHLDNASHVERLSPTNRWHSERLVYIGSIDCRVDFVWLDALMATGVGLDIYGKVHKNEPEIDQLLKVFLKRQPNAVFYGGYDNDQLSSILQNYKVGILPYHVNYTMTEHINPDKIYHYLNAGLEVIATPIPQCMRMKNYLHLTSDPKDIQSALSDAHTKLLNPTWPEAQYTWHQRWQDLLFLAKIHKTPNERMNEEHIISGQYHDEDHKRLIS